MDGKVVVSARDLAQPGWMMEGYRCVFGGSGADYSSSGTPDVTAGTPKLNDVAEVTATHPPSMTTAI